jgi:hypothetical protein
MSSELCVDRYHALSDPRRLTGDMLHLLSFVVLLRKIYATKSCRGISLKTQELYTLVFTCRYLDLFWNFISLWVRLERRAHLHGGSRGMHTCMHAWGDLGTSSSRRRSSPDRMQLRIQAICMHVHKVQAAKGVLSTKLMPRVILIACCAVTTA